LRAMALYKRMEAEGAAEAAAALTPQIKEFEAQPEREPAPADEKTAAEDGTVTPIDAAQRKRSEAPRPA
jgi:hypothetical protein